MWIQRLLMMWLLCLIGLVLNDNLKSKKDGGGLSVLDVCPKDQVEEEDNTNKDIFGSWVHVEDNSQGLVD